jgi:hypothetical protein
MSDIKYSICAPYLSRPGQLHNTLLSFRHFYGGRTDWELVLAEDDKDDAQDRLDLCSVVSEFGDLPIRVLDGHGSGMCRVTNAAVNGALGSIAVLTSPECVHEGDVLSRLDFHFAEGQDVYVVMACESVGFPGRVSSFPFGMTVMAKLKWYQHSIYHNRCLHFCTALKRSRYVELGGMCEEFDVAGVWYEDDDWLDVVKSAGIRIVTDDSVVVAHQGHPKSKYPDYWTRMKVNKELYARRKQAREAKR